MKKNIAILGSTGSIGECLLKIVKSDLKSFNIVLLSANKNYKKLFVQAKKFKVKNVILTDKKTFEYVISNHKNNRIRIYNDFNHLDKIIKNKIDYTMNSIVGLDGLDPTLKIIKYSKTIAIANKETIICGWNLIKKNLDKYRSRFIPVDSEHFSIWSVINLKKNFNDIEKIYLTASGGPFSNRKFNSLKNIKISQALNHPTWKMGKKITIDSATLINKVFEIIEAKKIFNINLNTLGILIHPSSYVHALIKFKNGLINIVAHETSMTIPIFNSLYWQTEKFLKTNSINLSKLNYLNVSYPKKLNFPLVNLIKAIPKKDSLFETVLVSANDYLVNLFLDKKIYYIDIIKILLKICKMKKFTIYKKIAPNTILEIIDTRNYTINEIKKLLQNSYYQKNFFFVFSDITKFF